jgi:hypothetical protein
MDECKILVVYEEVPEKTTLFVVDMTVKEFVRYSKLSGLFLNSTVLTKDLEEIANELYAKLFYSEYPTKGVWSKHEVSPSKALTQRVDGVLLTGMLL